MRLNTYSIFTAYSYLCTTVHRWSWLYVYTRYSRSTCLCQVCLSSGIWVESYPVLTPSSSLLSWHADYEVHLLTLHGCRVPEPRRRPYFGCRKVLYRSVIEVDIKMYTFSIGCGIYWYCKCKRNSAQSQGDDTVIKYFIISALNQITCSVYPRHFGAERGRSSWSAPFFCSSVLWILIYDWIFCLDRHLTRVPLYN